MLHPPLPLLKALKLRKACLIFRLGNKEKKIISKDPSLTSSPASHRKFEPKVPWKVKTQKY